MKILKIVFFILLLLFIVLLFILGGLYLFLDPNRLKPGIIEGVRKQGYILTIDDKIVWTIYPKIGINIKHMTLSVPNTEPFLDLYNVKISSELSQLLHAKENFQANIHVKALRLMNLHASNAYALLNWENKILTIYPINALFYDGKLSGIVHGQEIDIAPKWDWAMKAEGIQVKKFLADVLRGQSRLSLSGIGEIKFTSTSQGKGVSQVIQNVAGTNQFSVRNGVLEGIDLNYFVQAADALMNKQSVPPPPDIQETKFDNLSGTSSVQNGVVNAYVVVSAQTFTAQANGAVNLVTQTVNMQMKISTQKTVQTQWEIPVLITGDMHHPDFRLDMVEIQKQIVKSQLNKVKDEVKDSVNKMKEEIQTHVPGKAGEFLQNLLGH